MLLLKGRGVEVPGECPFLSGEYAMQYVSAMQAEDENGFVKAICNAKHFSSYDVEAGKDSEGAGAPYDRGSFNASVANQDLTETYLHHFRTAVQGGGLRGAMCRYYN